MEFQASLVEREKALRELAFRARGLVLDVATGSGYLARYLVEHADVVVCIDLDAGALRRTREVLSSSSLGFVCCDARRMPFRDDAFDAVLSWSALVHIPRWRMALGEMFRVSRGIVATCEPIGGYAVRAWRDYRCVHEPPTRDDVCRAFAEHGAVEIDETVFVDEILKNNSPSPRRIFHYRSLMVTAISTDLRRG